MKNVILGILALIILLLLLHTASLINTIKSTQADLGTTKNKLGQTVSMYEAKLTTSQEEIKNLTDSVFNMTKRQEREIKQVHAYYKGRIKVRVDSIPVPYVDSALSKKWADSILANCKDVVQYYEDSSVQIGTKAQVENSHYSISATIQKTGILINSLQFVDTQYIRVSTIKGGLLKKRGVKRPLYSRPYIRVDVLHTNPYFENKGADAMFHMEPKKHLFEKGTVVGAAVVLALFLL